MSRAGRYGAQAIGGSNRTSGDLAVIGSHDLSARTAGIAGGFDYRLTPNTVVGLAFGGAGTDWSLSQGLGGGKSDAFQAGIYAATRSGPAYLAAAFAFANHWMSTDRFAFASNHLTADFNAQSYGGRLEGGYRFGTIYGGITPYGAIQAQSFRTPDYSEVDVNGGGFALAFNGRTATDTRSELGARFDRVLAVYSNAVLALRTRLAWAHDWVSDADADAGVPGASRRELHRQRRAPGEGFGARLRRRRASSRQRRHGARKFDGEFASRSNDLRRHGHDPIHVVDGQVGTLPRLLRCRLVGWPGHAMWWQQRFGEFVTLFLVINPIGALPIFLEIAATLDPKGNGGSPSMRSGSRRRAVFFVVAGAFLLERMGISIRAFQISGGILLFRSPSK